MTWLQCDLIESRFVAFPLPNSDRLQLLLGHWEGERSATPVEAVAGLFDCLPCLINADEFTARTSQQLTAKLLGFMRQ